MGKKELEIGFYRLQNPFSTVQSGLIKRPGSTRLFIFPKIQKTAKNLFYYGSYTSPLLKSRGCEFHYAFSQETNWKLGYFLASIKSECGIFWACLASDSNALFELTSHFKSPSMFK